MASAFDSLAVRENDVFGARRKGRRLTDAVLPITLKRTTPRGLATAGRASGTVAQALRFIRRPQVDDSVIAKLRSRLGAREKQQLIDNIPLVPAWIGEVFRKVAAP